MNQIISCDWGTSSLRLRLVDTGSCNVLASVRSDDGILSCFRLWQEMGSGEKERYAFYQSVLTRQVKQLEEKAGDSLDDIPVVISGMASSGIGMMELAYKKIPFDLSNLDLNMNSIEPTKTFKHSVLLVSGIRSDEDVMRGEETQLIGCWNKEKRGDQLYIFPGTHSKHVWVKDGILTDLKTYMTGEFFDLLAVKSILASSVERADELTVELKNSFEQGLRASQESNLLHNAFLVRTNDLFKRLSKRQSYYYLSGMVIGAEMRDLRDNQKVTLVASGEVGELYSIALRHKAGHHTFDLQDPDEALVKGQIRIYSQCY